MVILPIINSFKFFILVVLCAAGHSSGDEDMTSVPNPAVNPDVDNGSEGGDVVEGVTEDVNGAVPDGNPEQAAPEGSAAGDVEGAGAEGPAAVPEGTAGSTPSTQDVAEGTDSSQPSPTKQPRWTDRLFAAKYMLTLGIVYIAVCLVMAMKTGPLVVH